MDLVVNFRFALRVFFFFTFLCFQSNCGFSCSEDDDCKVDLLFETRLPPTSLTLILQLTVNIGVDNCYVTRCRWEQS